MADDNEELNFDIVDWENHENIFKFITNPAEIKHRQTWIALYKGKPVEIAHSGRSVWNKKRLGLAEFTHAYRMIEDKTLYRARRQKYQEAFKEWIAQNLQFVEQTDYELRLLREEEQKEQQDQRDLEKERQRISKELILRQKKQEREEKNAKK